MGVQGLSSFVTKNHSEVSTKISILHEIREFTIKNNGKKPVIIFDTNSILNCFGNEGEILLGGRSNIYAEQVKIFFERLHKIADLLLICDSQLESFKVDEWCNRANGEFKQSLESIGLLKIGGYSFDKNNTEIRFKYFFRDLKRIANKYAEIIEANDCECDLLIAKYACEKQALAVVSPDTDFFIFEGNWQLWDPKSLDWDEFKIIQINRKVLCEKFRLSYDKMKILATIGGNDYTKSKWISLFGYKRNDFWKIIEFCRIFGEITDMKKACAEILNFALKIKSYRTANISTQQRNELLQLIQESIESYDLNFDLPKKNETDNSVDGYCKNHIFMHSVKNNKIYKCEMNYIWDNQYTDDTYFVNYIKTFKRLAGIILYDRKSNSPKYQFITKDSLHSDYKLRDEDPIYPENDVCSLEDLISESDKFDASRWGLLMWSLGLENIYSKEKIRKIPKEYLIVMFSVLFMLKTNVIKIIDADALLATEYTVIKKSKQATAPYKINYETVRIAQLYNRTKWLVSDCLYVCGLAKFICNSNFDGYLFHDLHEQFKKESMKLVNMIYLSDIDHLRIYAK